MTTMANESTPTGVIGSALGLVGLVSVYCDCVRQEVWICSFYLSVAARKKCLSRSVPERRLHVGGTLTIKQNKLFHHGCVLHRLLYPDYIQACPSLFRIVFHFVLVSSRLRHVHVFSALVSTCMLCSALPAFQRAYAPLC